MSWVISLCLSTHLSEEVGGSAQWFSDLAGHQVHLQTDQKQILGPLSNLLKWTPDGRGPGIYISNMAILM